MPCASGGDFTGGASAASDIDQGEPSERLLGSPTHATCSREAYGHSRRHPSSWGLGAKALARFD